MKLKKLKKRDEEVVSSGFQRLAPASPFQFIQTKPTMKKKLKGKSKYDHLDLNKLYESTQLPTHIKEPSFEIVQDLLQKSTQYIETTFRGETDLNKIQQETDDFIQFVYENKRTYFNIRSIENKGLVVFGLAALEDSVVPDTDNPTCLFVYELFVDIEYQNQGIGSQLLDYVIDYRNTHYPYLDIVLAVDPTNVRAQKLYNNFGFNYTQNTNEPNYCWMKYESLQYTISYKPFQKIQGVLDWNKPIQMSLKDRCVIRLRKGKELIGQCCIEVVLEENENYPSAWLFCFAVNPRYRKQGYGTQILQRVERWIKKNTSAEVIRLHAQKEFEDVLQVFYQNRGYIFKYYDMYCNNEMTFEKRLR